MSKKLRSRRPKDPKESGSAMLIAIFALMLISVVAIALVVSSGTDSSLAANYRTSTGAYYAGVAGLEEARGRLLWKNPNYINTTGSYSNLLAPPGPPSGAPPVTWGLTQVLYITNPNAAAGETVDPTNLSGPYADNEYFTEFGWPITSAAVYQIPSVSPTSSLPGPSYKWVRINAITEKALGVDVNGDGNLDAITPLVYDPGPLQTMPCPPSNPSPGLFVPNCAGWSSNTAVQALEITAYAVLPNGGHRLLQYIVAPLIISSETADQTGQAPTPAGFPAALTLDDGPNGGGLTFNPSSDFQISGVDASNSPVPPSCQGSVAAIAYSSAVDQSYITGQANPNKAEYPGPLFISPGCSPTLPSLFNVTLRQSWLWAANLDAAMQDIERSADVVLTGPANGTDIWNAAPAMSPTNPMTVVVNGDLTLSGSFGPEQTGYGLLLVTGTLTYHPSAAWNGIVLVVGKGNFELAGHHGSGGIQGSVFVAQTRDGSGNLLPGNSLLASFVQGGGTDSGNGITYNSGWVKAAQGPLTYKVLSFHEIPLPN